MQKPDIPVGLPDDIEDKKKRARAWFEALRDQIRTTFEALEDGLEGPHADMEPGRFEAKQWERDGGAGGGNADYDFD